MSKEYLGVIKAAMSATSRGKSPAGKRTKSQSPDQGKPKSGSKSASSNRPSSNSTGSRKRLSTLEKDPRKVTRKNETMERLGLKVVDLSGQGMTAVNNTVFQPPNNKDVGELDLSSNNLRNVPPDIQKLRTLVVLNLSKNGLKCTSHGDFSGLPKELASLPQLECVNISECNLPYVPPAIWMLKNLKELDISRNKINVLYPEVGNLMKLKHLNAQQTNIHTLPPEIAYCQELTELLLWGNVIDSLPETMREMPKLTRLAINYRSFCSVVDGYMENLLKKGQIQSEHIPPVVFEMPGIDILDLEETKINNLPEKCYGNTREIHLNKNYFQHVPSMLFDMHTLTTLVMSSNLIQEIPEQLGGLINLKVLKLDHNSIQSIPPCIGDLKNLLDLDLGFNLITAVPNAICKLANLKALNLENNEIHEIPDDIVELGELETLDLTANKISKLPICFYHMKKLSEAHTYHKFHKFGLWLHMNPLVSPPEEVWKSDSTLKIYRYLKKQEIKQTENLQRQKLIVLGDSQCGKTSLIQTMMTGKSNMTKDSSASTSIIDYTIWLTENLVDFMVHDMGGDQVYQMTHPMFLDPRALYLIVYDHRSFSPQNYYRMIGKWLDMLQLHAPGAVVKIAGTHKDLISQEFYETSLEQVIEGVTNQLYEQQTKIRNQITRCAQIISSNSKDYFIPKMKVQRMRLEVLANLPLQVQQDIRVVSSNEGIPGILELENDLEILAIDASLFPLAQRRVPTSWAKLRNSIKLRKEHYLTYEQYKMEAEEQGIMGKDIEESLEHMTMVGEALWFSKNAAMKDIIFHRPRHLVDILRGLFRHDMDNYFDFESNRVFASQGQFTANTFQQSVEYFRRGGQICRPMLKCLWFYLKLQREDFMLLQELLPRLGFAYLIPQDDTPLSRTIYQPLMVIPWYNKDIHDDDSLMKESWPSVAASKELVVHFTFPVLYPTGLYELLCSLVHDLLVERVDWRDMIIATLDGATLRIWRHLDPENYDCIISVYIRGEEMATCLNHFVSIYTVYRNMFLRCKGLVFYTSLETTNCTQEEQESVRSKLLEHQDDITSAL